MKMKEKIKENAVYQIGNIRAIRSESGKVYSFYGVYKIPEGMAEVAYWPEDKVTTLTVILDGRDYTKRIEGKDFSTNGLNREAARFIRWVHAKVEADRKASYQKALRLAVNAAKEDVQNMAAKSEGEYVGTIGKLEAELQETISLEVLANADLCDAIRALMKDERFTLNEALQLLDRSKEYDATVKLIIKLSDKFFEYSDIQRIVNVL